MFLDGGGEKFQFLALAKKTNHFGAYTLVFASVNLIQRLETSSDAACSALNSGMSSHNTAGEVPSQLQPTAAHHDLQLRGASSPPSLQTTC